jgi:hypothetical protein
VLYAQVVPLPKKQKTRGTSLYRILKLSLSLDVVDTTGESVAMSQPVPAPGEKLSGPIFDSRRQNTNFEKAFRSAMWPLLSRASCVVSKCAPDVEILFHRAIEYDPPPTGTEDRFHFTYDTNITTIIEFILSNTTAIRNNNRNTSTALQRPDYGLIVNTHCILRGEEKGSDTPGDPEKELLLKLGRGWDHDPLRCILGLL